MTAPDLVYVMPKDEVRRQLSLRYVCAILGIVLDEDGEAVCPFHDDSDPSFGTYTSDDGTHERWKCFPCSRGGDVFDLLIARHGYTFQDALNDARKLLVESTSSSWLDIESRIAPKPELDVATLSEFLSSAQHLAASYPDEMAAVVGFGPGWGRILLEEFGWGYTSDGWALLPHWDAAQQLTGVKLRGPGGAKSSVEGSRYRQLYGSWRPYDVRDVLIAEGEPDTIWASAFLRAWQVRGVPGASMFRREWLVELKGRNVWLAFDGDDAGDVASERWVKDLADVAKSVYEISVPREHDLRSWAPSVDELLRFTDRRS